MAKAALGALRQLSNSDTVKKLLAESGGIEKVSGAREGTHIALAWRYLLAESESIETVRAARKGVLGVLAPVLAPVLGLLTDINSSHDPLSSFHLPLRLWKCLHHTLALTTCWSLLWAC